ncbi:hypothetical protein [Bacillus toyonensis]|uniref:hypothetical protein n=1 Tax=Bacillus toyonensis TaxID=155322 RepID=UPI0015D5015D|nr:hypothetical protein [Bacillus toyonensis]
MCIQEKVKRAYELKQILENGSYDEKLEAIKEVWVLVGKLTREQANELEQFWKEVDEDC